MFVVTLTRLKETLAYTKDNKTEKGMLGNFSVIAENGDVLLDCYSMENAGEPTDESGKNKPIMPREYSFKWASSNVNVPKEYRGKGAGGGNKVVWVQDKNNSSFTNRMIAIHMGSSAIDTDSTIIIGIGYDEKKGTLTQSTTAVQKFYQLCEKYGIENFTFIVK